MKNVESSIHFIWKAILKMGCAENFARQSVEGKCKIHLVKIQRVIN
jgi:hypothetical protein